MKKESGVTLIALIVTIIVMLILVGITLRSVVGKNGVSTKMDETGSEINEAIRNANKKMNSVDAPIYYRPSVNE